MLDIANREDPGQTASKKQSDLGLYCLSRPFWQTTSVRNFRTFSISPFCNLTYMDCIGGAVSLNPS